MADDDWSQFPLVQNQRIDDDWSQFPLVRDQQQEQPLQTSKEDWSNFPLVEDPSRRREAVPEAEADSIPGMILRKAANIAGPLTAGAITGGAIGGSIGGPVGLVAGLVGGGATSLVTSYAQDKALDALGFDQSHRLAVDAAAHPYVDIATDVASMAIPFGAGARGATLAERLGQRAFGAGLGAITEAGGEYLQGRDIDPLRVGASAVGGGIFATPRSFVTKGEEYLTSRFRPGFPSEAAKSPVDQQVEKPNPAAVETRGTAREATPPDTGQPPVTGEPQNKVTLGDGSTESEGGRAQPREYGKDQPTEAARRLDEEFPKVTDPDFLRSQAASVRRDGNEGLAKTYEDRAAAIEAEQAGIGPAEAAALRAKTEPAPAAPPAANEPIAPPSLAERIAIARRQREAAQPALPPEPEGFRIREVGPADPTTIRPLAERPTSVSGWSPAERQHFIDDTLGKLSRGEIAEGEARAKLNRFDEVVENDFAKARSPMAALRNAFDSVRADQGNVGIAPISELISRSGLPKDQVHQALLDAAQRGEVTLHQGNQASASEALAIRDAAIHVEGEAPFKYAYFKPEAPQARPAQPAPAPLAKPPPKSRYTFTERNRAERIRKAQEQFDEAIKTEQQTRIDIQNGWVHPDVLDERIAATKKAQDALVDAKKQAARPTEPSPIGEQALRVEAAKRGMTPEALAQRILEARQKRVEEGAPPDQPMVRPTPRGGKRTRGVQPEAAGGGPPTPPPPGGPTPPPPGEPPTPPSEPFLGPRGQAIVDALRNGANRLLDVTQGVRSDLQMKIAPMATGSRESMATVKDFADVNRRISWDLQRYDTHLEKTYTPEERTNIWKAIDAESVALQGGPRVDVPLTAKERAALENDPIIKEVRDELAKTWQRMKELEMVEGEGLPSYAPRMAIGIDKATARAHGVPTGGAIPLDGLGANLITRTPQMRQRKYLTADETEAAVKKAFGDNASLVRDVRTLPLALAHMQRAVAGRELVNGIEAAGKKTGIETVHVGGEPPGKDWFTIDNPALKRWTPRFTTENGKTVPVRDANGDIVFDRVPIWVPGEYEGPLRSVLTQPSGATYSTLMELKGKTMGLIMNSPAIHNGVEWGRALPAMPGKVLTFRVYFDGAKAKKDVPTMHEAINAGLVPIGKRFFNQDISSIMEQPNLTPGRSWTSQVLSYVPGLFDPQAGVAVKRAIDRAGDFWHNTLLWDRVGDLQMGLYTNMRDKLVAEGTDRLTATRAAAHWANRYAGALPQEAMSDSARKISNMLLFSRSFTLGNLGVMKDMLTGLPRDVLAQIERDGGFPPGSIERADPNAPSPVAKFTQTMARRKAMMIVGLDMALMYAGNSLLQSGMNAMRGDESDQGYAARFSDMMKAVREHPANLLQPLDLMSRLSATHTNEPGRQERVLAGYAKDGTAIYARNPAGKIGEEFIGYPFSPIDMLKRKLGTIARPGWEIMANDRGFGQKIYDPSAHTPSEYLKNIGRIVTHLVGGQVPVQQLAAAKDLITGEGDRKLAALQTLGPLAGITFSKGAPGGPAVGEMYTINERQRLAFQQERPDIMKQIQRGDISAARKRMTELAVAPGLQNYYVRVGQNPATRLGGRTLTDAMRAATPEERGRLENAIRQQRSRQLMLEDQP